MSISTVKNEEERSWQLPLSELLVTLLIQIFWKEFFETMRVKIRSEKDFVKLVGKILAEDVIDEQTGLVFRKSGREAYNGHVEANAR